MSGKHEGKMPRGREEQIAYFLERLEKVQTNYLDHISRMHPGGEPLPTCDRCVSLTQALIDVKFSIQETKNSK